MCIPVKTQTITLVFAQEHRGLLSIRYPMEHGIVKDWNDMERIWQYVYSKDQLQTFSEEVRYLIMNGTDVVQCVCNTRTLGTPGKIWDFSLLSKCVC